MNSMRFYLVFDVEGNASEQLSRLSTQFVELGSAGNAASSGMHSFHGTVIAAIHGLRQLEEVGHGVTEMGYGLLGVLHQLGAAAVENASQFETLRTRMDFAFGAVSSGAIWENVQKYAVESVYQFDEVAGIVGRLGIAIPGVAREFEELGRNYRARNGDMIDAFHVLGDTATGTGRSLTMVGYEAMQMMAGVWRGAHQVLHLTHEETNQIKHVIQSTTDTAVQFSKIMEVLAAHYGGATQSMGHTLAFLRLQIPDIMQVIEARIGARGLGFITKGVEDLVHWLREMIRDGRAIDALGSAFAMAAEYGGKFLNILMRGGMAIERFIANHPEAVKFAMVLTAILGTMSVLGGTLLAVTAGMGVFVASMTLAGGAIVSVMGMTALAVGGLAVGMAGLIAVGALFYRAYDQNLGGLQTRFNQVRLIVVALSEAIQHWNGDMTYISLQTGAALQRAGILDFFVNLVGWIRRGQEWWTGFVAGMEEGMNRVNWNGITQGIQALERAFAMLGVSLHLLDPAVATSFDTMQQRGHSFADTINNVIIPGLNMLIDLFRAGAWTVEHVLFPGINFAASATLSLMNNWEAVKGTLFLVGLFLAPIPTVILGLISMTGSWEMAANGVLAVFRTIKSVAELIGSIMSGVGSAINYVGRGFVPPDSIPAPAPAPSYVSHSDRVLDDDRRSSYNPFEHGGPAYVHDNGGASTEQTPLTVRMAQAGAGNMTPTGNLGGTDLAALLARIEQNTRSREASGSTQSSTPAQAPAPNASFDPDAAFDSWQSRSGGISR